MLTRALLAALLVLPAGRSESRQPHEIFKNTIGLSDAEIAAIEGGEAVAKVLDVDEKSEVHVFGAVYVNAPVEVYADMVRDVESLAATDAYMAVKVFSDPPQESDVATLTLEEQDIKDLRKCKPGDCNVQLGLRGFAAVQDKIDWNAPDVADQVNRLARELILEAITIYRAGGLGALGAYRDKDYPASFGEMFATLLGRAEAFADYAPQLHDYVLDYPKSELEGTEDFLYWEKVKFGLKPTIRVNHVTLYQVPHPRLSPFVVVNKQIYASHYFQGAVDLSFCIKDTARPAKEGFFLITRKASRQHGLTGLKGSIVRKVAVGRTRESLEKGLAVIKAQLEGKAPAKPGK